MTLTAKSLSDAPDIKAPKFSIITKAIGGETINGRRRFKATASSTITDRAGDEISLSALEQMADNFRAGLTIFMDHDNKVENAFGTTDRATIVQRGVDPKSGQPVYDLDVEGVVNEPSARAVQLHESIEGGYVKFGASIDAFVKDHTRKGNGAMKIDGLEAYAASIVGVPMNQRSWTQKAVRAIKGFYGEPEDDVSEGVEVHEGETATLTVDTEGNSTVTIEKAEMSSHTRTELPDSAFACPEQRKYPIKNSSGQLDAAHVRNALARVADPSNDQCGKEAIMAAAKKLGIGEHGKSVDGAETTEPTIQKGAEVTVGEDGPEAVLDITKDVGGADSCPSCGKSTGEGDDCPDSYHSATSMKSLEDSVTTDAQESSEETPETASVETDGGETDTVEELKVATVPTDDMAALMGHVQHLVKVLSEQTAENARLRAELDKANATRIEVQSEVDIAKQVIEKVMQQPLRPRAQGYIAEFSNRFPDFDPEIAKALSRIQGEQ